MTYILESNKSFSHKSRELYTICTVYMQLQFPVLNIERPTTLLPSHPPRDYILSTNT